MNYFHYCNQNSYHQNHKTDFFHFISYNHNCYKIILQFETFSSKKFLMTIVNYIFYFFTIYSR